MTKYACTMLIQKHDSTSEPPSQARHAKLLYADATEAQNDLKRSYRVVEGDIALSGSSKQSLQHILVPLIHATWLMQACRGAPTRGVLIIIASCTVA